MESGVPGRRVAFVSGATGFIGSGIARALLGQGFVVMVLIREKSVYSKRGELLSTLGMAERLERLRTGWALDAEASERLVGIAGDLSCLDSAALADQIRDVLENQIQADTIDTVINCAARLTMEHAGLSPQKRQDIQERNHATNVQGMERLLGALDCLASPTSVESLPLVRIIRPSIVAGRGSRDAYMAFLHYLNKSFMGLRLATILRFVLKTLPRSVCVPLPGNPDSTLDIVDENEVIQAVLGLVEHDLARQVSPAKGGALEVASIHHLSTAFVHGRRSGVLLEEELPSAEEVQPKNSYEATKAQGEHVLAEWLRGHMTRLGLSEDERRDEQGSLLLFNQIANPNAPTFQQVAGATLMAFGWSSAEVERVRFFAQGEPFTEAMRELRSKSYIGHKIASDLWEEVPMLKTYLSRPTGIVFSTTETRATLARVGVDYDPQSFDSEYVKQLLRETN